MVLLVLSTAIINHVVPSKHQAMVHSESIGNQGGRELYFAKTEAAVSTTAHKLNDQDQQYNLGKLSSALNTMSHKVYCADEIEQKLIHQIKNNTELNNMMDESTPPISGNKASSLYMDEVDLGGDYNPASSPPAITVLNMDGKGNYLDDKKSNKHGRYYRNMVGPIAAFVMGILFMAAIVAIVVASTGKKNMNKVATMETPLASPQEPVDVPESSKNKYKPEDDFIVLDEDEDEFFYEDEYQDEDDFIEGEEPDDYPDEEDMFVEGEEQDDYPDEEADDYADEADDYDDEMVCAPEIKLRTTMTPQSIPVIASDGETIVVKHGKKLNFYESDRTQTFSYLSLPQTHARSTNSYETEDMTLALDGDTSIMGHYLRDGETGAVYILTDNGEGERENIQVIVAPEDVDDGGMFGFSVDIYGDRLIVGAPFGYGDDAGAAYTYEQNDEGTWELADIFPPPEEDAPEDNFVEFGSSVALHRDRAAISGYNEYDEVTVFVYEYNSISDSWEEIDDIIVDKNCHDCEGVGVDIAFRDDGGLFISYPRKNEVTYLVPTNFENGGEYVVQQKILIDQDVAMDQVEVGGTLMVVGVKDDYDTNLVYVYSQSDDDDKWFKVDQIELPPNPDFDPDEDYIDLALSSSNLIVNYGDSKLIWYTLDGCER